MMKTIAKKTYSSTRFLVGNQNDYELRFKKLQEVFAEGRAYTLFAQPLVAGNQILWQTELSGSVTPYPELSQSQKTQADAMLSQQASDLFSVSKGKIADEILHQYFSLPDKEDIYLINTDNGARLIITRWGSVSDDPDEQPVSILKEEHFPVPVVFVIQYTNGEAAPNELLFIDFNSRTNQENSRDEARIDFGKINKGTLFRVYQKVEGEDMFVHEFKVDNRIEYLVQLPPLQTIEFKIQDSNGLIKSNYDFCFEYSGETATLTSDEEGMVRIENIKVGTKFRTYKLEEEAEKYEHRFVCRADGEPNLIVIPAPVVIPVTEVKEPNALKIKLIDHKKKPVANQKIQFKYKEQEYELTTDDTGYCNLVIDEIHHKDVIEAVIEVLEKKDLKKQEKAQKS